MNLKNKIIVLDEVLTPEECAEAIRIFKDSKEASAPEIEKFRDTLLLQISSKSPFLQNLSNKIKEAASFLTNGINIDWSQIVEWETGSMQQYHKDDASNDTVFTSITYLNGEYWGGQTIFHCDIAMVPKVGRTVYFDGNHYIHGVTQIEEGVRYTLPIWYKNAN